MRLMKRNQTAIYYCLYKGKEPLLDEDGNETSEYRVLYERPVKLMCSVSHATGYAQVNMGAMAAPLINALAPAIDFVIGKVVALFNILNQ